MNEPKCILRFPVYEPGGREVVFDENDLLQHLLIIGATGSGKTSLLHRVIEQLIQHKAGLLIFDAKGDDTVARVKRIAASSGRANDVVVLGPAGNHYLNLFRPLRSLADVDRMSRRILVGSGSMGPDNKFWDEFRFVLVDTALTLLVVSEKRVKFGAAMSLLHEWFLSPKGSIPPRIQAALAIAAQSLPEASPVNARKLSQAMDTVRLWQALDDKTRGNAQSTLLNALRPLLSIPAANCFESHGRPVFDPANIARRGAVCIVSFNATLEPALASLFFKLVKEDFLGAVQQRAHNRHPLCGIIADEFPLLVVSQDGETLATVRSRRCFFIGATQGLSALDERVGVRIRKALVANFGSIIFMRGREEETDLLAAVSLGTRQRVTARAITEEEGSVLSITPRKFKENVLVCPPGELGRLAPHEGFAVRPNRERCDLPLTFVPWFEEPQQENQHRQADDPFSAQHLKHLLQANGFRVEMDQKCFEVALNLCSRTEDRQYLIEYTMGFFRTQAAMVPRGLSALPSPWLKALPGILWAMRAPHHTHLPYMICELVQSDGLLLVRFAQEASCELNRSRTTAWDKIRVVVNASLYPSRWRRLTPRHHRWIQSRSPDLLRPARDSEIF